MSLLLGTELWDKPESIITFNENNTLIIDKFQKVIADFLKSQLMNTISQKKLLEKFLNENKFMKTSQFNFASNTYFLTEQIIEMMNANETFSNTLLSEFDDIIKVKSMNTKKDTRLLKAEMKTLVEDLSKENLKLDNDFKRYRARFNAKDFAYNAYLKADANKALSRNQVENYHSIYITRNGQYEETKKEYLQTLENFNKYQSKHYSTLLEEWGRKAETIETERYSSLKTTFTNVTEVCKSMASKYIDIANQIESKMDTIECEKDCTSLINKEKSGDVPPRDIPFKDFDIQEKVDVCLNEPRMSKTSNSGSENSSSINGAKKNSVNESLKSIRSSSAGAIMTKNTTSTSNGGTSSGFFSKLLGGNKKSKSLTQEPAEQINQSEIEHLEALLEEKNAQGAEYDLCEDFDQETSVINKTLETLRNDDDKPEKSATLSRPVSNSENCSNKSVVDNASPPKETSLFKRLSRGSFRSMKEKRRSRSVTNVIVNSDVMVNNEKNQQSSSTDIKSTIKPKPKWALKPNMRSKSISRDRQSIGSGTLSSKTIEVLRNVGKVEIVSTPAEALASAARESCTLTSDQEVYSEVGVDENRSSTNFNTSYDYYYVGSCVAIHEYKSTDPSKIYLSFEVGEQFYIIQENDSNESTGWLLVENIDKTQLGYVPASYMDTRRFDAPVLMYSDHPLILA